MRGVGGGARLARAVGAGAVLSFVAGCGASGGDWDAAREEFAVEGPAILKAADAAYEGSGGLPRDVEDLGLDEAAITPSDSRFRYEYGTEAPLSDEVVCAASVQLWEKDPLGETGGTPDAEHSTDHCDPGLAIADREVAFLLAAEVDRDFALVSAALSEEYTSTGLFPGALVDPEGLDSLGLDPSAMSAEVGGVTYDLQQSGAEPSPHVSYSYVPLRDMNATQPGTEVCGFVLRAAWPYGGFTTVRVEVDHCPALEPLS